MHGSGIQKDTRIRDRTLTLPWSLNAFRARRAAAAQSETMADHVARALNSLSDSDSARSLSSHDQRDLSHFIEDFFCSAPNDQAEEGEDSGGMNNVTMRKSEFHISKNILGRTEADDTGKGANTVISFLHHFLHHHGLGESELAFHADNCTGQNKNNTVLQVRE